MITIIKLTLMTQKKVLTHLQGLDVSEYRVVELSRENLISAGFEKCPQKYRHLLVHAVQFQQPIPSLASMERTEKRNKAKAGKGKAQPALIARPRRQAKRKIKGSFKRLAPSFLPNTSNTHTKKKSSFNPIKVRSPEQLVLKAARLTCQGQLSSWFGQGESEDSSELPLRNRVEKGHGDKNFPIYFQKRHRSHRRRMQERWQLIKANRDKLVEIYGGEILGKSCRISIKEVKIALRMHEDTKMDVEGVGEFMAMIDESKEDCSYSSSYSRSVSSYSQSSRSYSKSH